MDKIRIKYIAIGILLLLLIPILLAGIFLNCCVRVIHPSWFDARIIAALGQIRTQAEIYFDENETYIGLEKDPVVRSVIEDINKNGSTADWGAITKNSYVVWSKLPYASKSLWFYDYFQCVDSSGKAGKIKSTNLNLQAGISKDCGFK